jgi:hypothetical protein
MELGLQEVRSEFSFFEALNFKFKDFQKVREKYRYIFNVVLYHGVEQNKLYLGSIKMTKISQKDKIKFSVYESSTLKSYFVIFAEPNVQHIKNLHTYRLYNIV